MAKEMRCYCSGEAWDASQGKFIKLPKPHKPDDPGCEWPVYVHDVGNYCDDCEHSHEWSECHPYSATTACESLWECSQGDAAECPYFIDQLNSDEEE